MRMAATAPFAFPHPPPTWILRVKRREMVCHLLRAERRHALAAVKVYHVELAVVVQRGDARGHLLEESGVGPRQQLAVHLRQVRHACAACVGAGPGAERAARDVKQPRGVDLVV